MKLRTVLAATALVAGSIVAVSPPASAAGVSAGLSCVSLNGKTYSCDAFVQPAGATITWARNGSPLPGFTGRTFIQGQVCAITSVITVTATFGGESASASWFGCDS